MARDYLDTDPFRVLHLSNPDDGMHTDALVYGGDGSDPNLQGTGVGDVINGYDGSDVVHAYGGDDVVFGGNGSDVLFGEDGTDYVYGDGGRDQLDGGKGVDYMYGGAASDVLHGGLGGDRLYGGNGADTYTYTATVRHNGRPNTGESTGVHRDVIKGFDFDGVDLFAFTFEGALVPQAIDDTVVGGVATKATFDLNLSLAVDAAHLAARHAVLFEPDVGDMRGKVFLIVDANGVGGYQAGEDFVIQLVKANHLSDLDVSDFLG